MIVTFHTDDSLCVHISVAYSMPWSSSKALAMLTTSLTPLAMVTTSLTGIESLSYKVTLQEQSNSIVMHDVTDSTHQPVATVTFGNTTAMITSQAKQTTGGQFAHGHALYKTLY